MSLYPQTSVTSTVMFLSLSSWWTVQGAISHQCNNNKWWVWMKTSPALFFLHIWGSLQLVYSVQTPCKRGRAVDDVCQRLDHDEPYRPLVSLFSTTSLWITDNGSDDVISLLLIYMTMTEATAMTCFPFCLHADGIGINPAQTAGEAPTLFSAGFYPSSAEGVVWRAL